MKYYTIHNDPTNHPAFPDYGLINYMAEICTRGGDTIRGYDKTKEGAYAALRRAYYEFYGRENCAPFDQKYADSMQISAFIMGHGAVYGAGIRG